MGLSGWGVLKEKAVCNLNASDQGNLSKHMPSEQAWKEGRELLFECVELFLYPVPLLFLFSAFPTLDFLKISVGP